MGSSARSIAGFLDLLLMAASRTLAKERRLSEVPESPSDATVDPAGKGCEGAAATSAAGATCDDEAGCEVTTGCS
eukprot:11232810-Alexandrium_andersonii.AAC.1